MERDHVSLLANRDKERLGEVQLDQAESTVKLSDVVLEVLLITLVGPLLEQHSEYLLVDFLSPVGRYGQTLAISDINEAISRDAINREGDLCHLQGSLV